MPAAVVTGFFGKLPARGDFVRGGLPSSFVEVWDGWLSHVLTESRTVLGDRWQPAWMEAPVWRFHLPAGQTGPAAMLGLWMPSVDAAGRCFPLTLAAVSAARSDPWLDGAEACGRAALEADMAPAALSACLDGLADDLVPQEQALTEASWWTEGAPLVPAAAFGLAALPDAAMFAAMLAGPEP